ncbi:FecR family protein [Chitinophaga nivalis]|uniref:FecR domain-containing protein n=1 Tax=Chitinophaga nivalis TaxID=2991709 RepID=A0ABT3INZ9_9BACT|nr:FecR family protein [Chitinophaga nivalis]MCW3464794.1 FecR domain-containing protein [Chitinophaga nivalis]MCW3485515.1 FecR domain-containing protein [Chitinophaga nivalis]
MGQQLPDHLPRWLLLKYKQGNCTAEEVRLVDAWFDHTADVISPEEAPDLEAVHQHVMERIRKGTSKKVKRIRLYAAAASLVLLFTTFLMKNNTRRVAPPASWTAIHTSAGELKRIILPDSSSVLLNSCSQLRYRQDFTQQREVYLQGEAFFDIKADAGHAFRVQSDSLHVQVLGTRFNMAVYPNEGTAAVVLESGQVKVNGTTNPAAGIVLRPGEILRYAGGNMQVKEADLESAFAWQQGMLLYKNVPLGDICKDLERRYGVHIRIVGKKLPATAWYYTSRRIPLPTVLKVLSESGSGFHYTINNNEIIIR